MKNVFGYNGMQVKILADSTIEVRTPSIFLHFKSVEQFMDFFIPREE